MWNITQIYDCEQYTRVEHTELSKEAKKVGKVHKYTYVAGDKEWQTDFKSNITNATGCPNVLHGKNVTISKTKNSKNLVYT